MKGTKTTTSTKTISGKLRSWVSGPNKLSTNKSVGYSPRQPTKIRQPKSLLRVVIKLSAASAASIGLEYINKKALPLRNVKWQSKNYVSTTIGIQWSLTRTTNLPKFLPSSSPIKALGASSKPLTNSSRYLIRPCANQLDISLKNSS